MSTNTYSPLLPCFKCNTPLDVSVDVFVKYLYKNEQNCPHCKAHRYLWNSALKSLSEPLSLKQHASVLLGANLKTFKIEISQNQTYKLDLTIYNIPSNAHILNINFTPEGDSLLPLLLFPTNEISPLHKIPVLIRLYGRPLKFDNSNNNRPSYTRVNVSVIYSTHTEDRYSLDRLFSAFQAFLQSDYGLMGHDAHSSIEDSLNSIIKIFENRLSVSSLSLGYEKNLSIRLKEICYQYNIPLLENNHKKLLIKLYKEIRNERTHGTTPIQISTEKAAEFFCVAIFTYHYLVELKQRINK